MWYVLYTRSKAEKKVADTLEKMKLEVYCPMTTEIHQWSDRKKKVTVPLFRSYVFVRLNEKERHLVFDVPGVVKYLYWLGKPAIVRDTEIETIQNWLTGEDLEDLLITDLTPGDRVILQGGAFRNKEAIIKDASPKRVRLILLELGCTVSAKTRDVLRKVS